MSITAINPNVLFDSLKMGFSHVVKTNRQTTIYCSGQVALDKDNNFIGEGDIAVQAKQVLENLKMALNEAGAEVSDVVRLRTYVVNHNPSLLEPIGKAIAEFYGEHKLACNTLIGVDALALPEFLIEIEATAKI